jgi:hypothetical protein
VDELIASFVDFFVGAEHATEQTSEGNIERSFFIIISWPQVAKNLLQLRLIFCEFFILENFGCEWIFENFDATFLTP